jgi:hypothetical protein
MLHPLPSALDSIWLEWKGMTQGMAKLNPPLAEDGGMTLADHGEWQSVRLFLLCLEDSRITIQQQVLH